MSINDDPTPPARRAKRVREWLINIALIVAIVGGVQWWKARPLASGEAPPLAGVALDGGVLDLADMKGRPVLVHFWASWCPMCRVMDGAVDAIARDHAVITVAMQSGDSDELNAFMREAGQDFPVIADPAGQITSRWGVRGVPASFVVDAAGRIRYTTVGVSTEPGLRARLWLAGE
jgi:peroxiredoxin